MLAANPPFELANESAMNRLWQISLPLSCCLLGAALWTAMLRDSGNQPDVREAMATAQHLRSIRERLAAPRFDDDSSLVSAGPVGAQVAAQGWRTESAPPEHSPLDFAKRLENRTARDPGSTMAPTPAELPMIATTSADDSAARVSIVRWSGAMAVEPASQPELPASRPELIARLSPQEQQISGAHLHYGKILARKGATSSARGEFLNALTVIAQSRDLHLGDKSCLTALQRAIRTLDEADDFHADRSGSGLDTDVATISEGHISRVLNPEQAKRMTPTEAIAAYQASAREDIERACGRHNPCASEVLFALGRLHALLGQADPGQQPREETKSITFHQAALTADPNNFASANELGVLLARKGQWAQARELLLRSVSLGPRPETWSNLATLHRRLGENDLAQLATREAELLAAGSVAANPPMVRLVPPAEFEAIPDTQDAGPPNQTAQQPASPSTNQWR